MTPKHICPICEKEFKNKGGLASHIKFKHKEETKPLEKVEEVKPFLKDIEPTNIYQEIYNFFDKLQGRTAGTQQEVNKMIGWYREIFGEQAPHADPTCSQCVNHVYQSLRKIYLDNKQRKEDRAKDKEKCCG